MITKKNQQRIERFLAAHKQHEVEIQLHPHKVRIQLHFHNGDNWMGLIDDCKTGDLNAMLLSLLKKAEELRPDLLQNVVEGN